MKDRVVFVTGAGQGLGKALALSLAAQGATLVLHGRKVEKLEATYDEIIASGGAEPFIMPLDFLQTDIESFAQIAEAIGRECGKLDSLIHCAAQLGAVSPLQHQSAEHLRSTWLVNAMAPIMLTRALEAPLRKSAAPVLIFTTDSHVADPAPYWGGYGVSKAAIHHFAKMLEKEWDFARVHTIAPGAIDSPLRNKTHPGEAKSTRIALPQAVAHYIDLLK